MIVLPVIGRELRASARQPFTFSLRALGVAALLLASLLFGLEHGFGPTLGSRLFGSLHLTLFGAIWVLVPLLTADCISRERREGTLGLLFLTRLRATDIVTAKSMAHGLRALTLWLAVAPVLTIPFLLGGITWPQALLSVSVNFSAICWALAAGLLASAWSKRWVRSLLAASILSLLLLLPFVVVSMELILMGKSRAAQFALMSRTDSDYALLLGVSFISASISSLSFFSSIGQMLWTIGLMTSTSLLVLLLAIVICGRKTDRVWQERPASRLEKWWQATFCTPMFWLKFFRRWMLRKLERNPIGWLEQRTWTGRLVIWGWFAVIMSLYSAVLTDPSFFRTSSGFQRAMAWLLIGSLAMSAAGSFRRERESGVLELLLVSPLGEGDIISGRLRGLWSQFLPAFGLLLGLWAYFTHLFPDHDDGGAICFHLITFLALPVVGLYYSLRCRNFIAAFLSTLVVGLLVPLMSTTLFSWVTWFYHAGSYYGSPEFGPSLNAGIVEGGLAVLCLRALHGRLRRRSFPFTQESSR